ALGIVALGSSRRRIAAVGSAAAVLLALQRGIEMKRTYPTLSRDAMAPVFSGLSTLAEMAPGRIVGVGGALRPNIAGLYGLEDVRGYESLVLARFADTEPLWSEPQFSSFNRVDGLDRPFLSFLGARLAAAGPGDAVPAGWSDLGRSATLWLFENPSALPRAFAPSRIRQAPPARVLEEMRVAANFGSVAWEDSERSGELVNPAGAFVGARESGPDLVV